MRGVPLMLILALSIVTGATLAGCLGPPQVTAHQAQAFTDDHIMQTDPDARLVFVAGLEGRVENQMLRGMLSDTWLDELGFASQSEQEVSYWDRIEEDGNPGNGRAELWVLHYAAGDGEHEHVLLVDRDLNVLHQEQRPASDHQDGIGDYPVDSDRAMRIAKQASPELRVAVEASNLIVGSGLVVDPTHGGPVWTISAMGGDLQGFQGAFVQLDARTGGILHQDSESLQY